MKPSILWFRQDLRIHHNPALHAAIQREGPVIPVYIWSPEEEGDWAPGGASKWWLHQSLKSLEKELAKLGSRLIYRKGNSLRELKSLIKETGADAVFWNRRYEPAIIKRDTEIKKVLQKDGIQVNTFNSYLLFEPWEIKNKAKQPYKIFTAFYNTYLSFPNLFESKMKILSEIPGYSEEIYSLPITELRLKSEIDWAKGIRETWTPGREGFNKIRDRFFHDVIPSYSINRDFPGKEGTSKVSPYLHFGEISPGAFWEIFKAREKYGKETSKASVTVYKKELIWREFAYHLLYHFPHTVNKPLRPEFEKLPWRDDYKSLKTWQRGETGYPIIDAGMRELWTTGWMHNRVRMIVGSFLVKDLLLPWQLGAKWFWDTLVDADLANNTMNWQWVAGCGADASPFFRIFNPVTQGEKFDPDGIYIRKWIPELKKLHDDWIHKPWTAPSSVLSYAGIELGKTYPKPIIDHAFARERALAAFKKIKK